MLKQGRSTCPIQSDNMSPNQIMNVYNNESKISSEISSTPLKVNFEKQKINNPINSNERNQVVFPSFPRQPINNERKKSEVSYFDANCLDDIFNGMRNRIKSHNSNEIMISEKSKISRAINLLFKNNLPEFNLNDFKNLKIKENYSLNKVDNMKTTIHNINNNNNNQASCGNNKDKLLFTTVHENKVDKNPPIFNVDNCIPKKVENSNNGIYNY
jgi:hypothetical protein